ncbi:hypothetical protein C7974DRAFT_431383 [Boeremia exigua]|uniref:uncharacterized protein n=1 Tax=Boeremia exigua TaxID=749465 RepID=UPI001E8DA773|nr:uncharacterized protein C7974DRAFT_431383 [Boeremia exigua]KAH6643113.1 hypothetical protein C7974DRAFT_431383 [Boeremia exigua]
MLHLPDELILHIIASADLELAELVTLQHVSRQFLNLSRDNRLWKQLCFAHSATERRRRRLETTSTAPPADADPRLADLIEAANRLAGSLDVSVHDARAPDAEAQVRRSKERRRAALLSNWDPSSVGERVNWYSEFVQRHGPHRVSWFQDAGHDGEDGDAVRREATGADMLYDANGLAARLVAPLDDGSVSVWDAAAHSSRLGRVVATSAPGLLSRADRAQSRAIMTATGAAACVSIDSARQTGFFAVQDALVQVDLHTLQLVARTPFASPVTALSDAHPATPLTVGTNWSLHLHDPRAPSPGPAAALAQPGALSIAHTPSLGDSNGPIWAAGRFPSLLNYDRRFFPRLRGALYTGTRTACLALLPTPLVPPSLRLTAPPEALVAARHASGITLAAAGAYKGRGALDLYSLSSSPERAINSADAGTARNPGACARNRQTAGRAALLGVAPHGTRIVCCDGAGEVRWVERDGWSAVRAFNINDVDGACTGRGDMVQRLIPTLSPSLVTPETAPQGSRPPALGTENLVLWTGDGRLGMLGFGRAGLFDEDVFADALEWQVGADEVDARALEREYGREMRRALEMQAREVRWLEGYGL